jgi:hypothetical protein
MGSRSLPIRMGNSRRRVEGESEMGTQGKGMLKM